MNHVPVRPGDILAGKYEVEKVLGAGGMGVVVAAQHLQLRERVALKFLLPDVMLQHDAVERFLREARAAARIKCEHIARVFDVGMLDNGVPYMVVEYLEGSDLSRRLTKYRQLDPQEAVDFVLQACEAMAEAHALGIIHRDLKPSNLFVAQRPNGEPMIKVLDFGISKVLVSSDDVAPPSLTATNGVIGSPLYMSPEQVRNAKTVDARSDIWALGVILYELIAGTPPFEGKMVPEVIAKIAADPPTPLRSKRPEVDPGLEKIILRCLEKDPSRRYNCVAEFATALMPYGGARGQIALHRITSTSPALLQSGRSQASAVGASSLAETRAADAQPGRTTRSRRNVALIVAYCVVVLGVVVGVAFVVARAVVRDVHPANMLPGAAIDSAGPSAIASLEMPSALPSASAPASAPPVVAATTPQAKTPSTSTAGGTTTGKQATPPPSSTKGIKDLINDRR